MLCHHRKTMIFNDTVPDRTMCARRGPRVEEREFHFPVPDRYKKDLIEGQCRDYRGENDLHLGDVSSSDLLDPIAHRETLSDDFLLVGQVPHMVWPG
jgi:hypothetical protein